MNRFGAIWGVPLGTAVGTILGLFWGALLGPLWGCFLGGNDLALANYTRRMQGTDGIIHMALMCVRGLSARHPTILLGRGICKEENA